MTEDFAVSQSWPGDGAPPILPPASEPSAAHTPGPWFAHKSTATFWDVTSIDNSFGPAVASVWSVSARHNPEANARLMAAAPELLDTLINVLNDLAPLDYDDEELEPGNGAAVSAYWMRASVIAARAAIAKAEGRQ